MLPRWLPPSNRPIRQLEQGAKWFEEFQEAHNGKDLDIRNKLFFTILIIQYLNVATMPPPPPTPIKFLFNLSHFSGGKVVWRI